jgi:hypothetical protein
MAYGYIANCGVLTRSRFGTVMVGGCGAPVWSEGRLVRWRLGEEFVCYHARCRPDVGAGRPIERRVI